MLEAGGHFAKHQITRMWAAMTGELLWLPVTGRTVVPTAVRNNEILKPVTKRVTLSTLIGWGNSATSNWSQSFGDVAFSVSVGNAEILTSTRN